MDRDEFRIKHSTLLEQYQYIEHHLEGIYASTWNGSFISGLDKVAESTIGKIVAKIKLEEDQQKESVIPDEVYCRLEAMRERRNFWCHNCYVDMTFENDGSPRKASDIKTLLSDLREAEELREVLYQIKLQMLSKKSTTFSVS
ncbi:MAG: hypothetical protein E7649_02400 [Ruminococcaceae bacterium]|nr:hypothetical protein [Oscillospiraceae bacterium]